MDAGAFDARVANHWAKGGAGATELGQNRALKYLLASFGSLRIAALIRRGCYRCLCSLQGGWNSFQVRSSNHVVGILIIRTCVSSGRFLYPLELSLKDKIEIICKEMYGADGVEYSEQAEQRIQVRVITLMDAIVLIILFIFLRGKGLH